MRCKTIHVGNDVMTCGKYSIALKKGLYLVVHFRKYGYIFKASFSFVKNKCLIRLHQRKFNFSQPQSKLSVRISRYIRETFVNHSLAIEI